MNRIIFNGYAFNKHPKQLYFYATVKQKKKSLHRYVWELANGEIPEGYDVHHKDENPLNNAIDNLEVLPKKEHAKKHAPASAERMRKIQPIGIEMAKEWHGGEDGKAWHQQHYENVKEKLYEKIERNCDSCGKPVLTNRKNVRCFCSNNCKSAWRRKNNPDKKMAVCPVCGSEFETLKYLPRTYCSKACKPAPNPYGGKGKKGNLAKDQKAA